MAYYAFLLISACLSYKILAADPGCVDVAPADNYYNALFIGQWYEIGKIQTAGGAFFQRHCWCDGLEFESESLEYGDGEVTYSCRKDGPEGNVQAATADLFYEGTPGSFKQHFHYPFARKLNYTVVYIDEDTAMEYDCDAKDSGVTSYCVHFLSRVPYIDDVKLQDLINYAESLGLNNQHVSYNGTKQDGCWPERLLH